MRLWEKLSTSTFKFLFRNYSRRFEESSPEAILRNSLRLLDETTINEIRSYIKSRQHHSGGFRDKAGNPDLYYTLFGYFLISALELNETRRHMAEYVDNEIRTKELDGIHLYCAAIIASGLSLDRKTRAGLKKRMRKNFDERLATQPAYSAFVTLLACYYSNDLKGIMKIKKHLRNIEGEEALPSTVVAALIVLNHTFGKNTSALKNRLAQYYNNSGGFRAVKKAPLADLLSTAVCLYAHRFAFSDLRSIKPECLSFVDSLYRDGGFGANDLDPEPDIEYTFYGLLALGSLA